MNASSQKPSDRFMPYLFVVAPLVFIFLMLAWLIWSSVHNYPGEVTTGAYEKGLRYNALIEKSQMQEKLGWQSNLAFKTKDFEVNTDFELTDKNGKAITDANVIIWFIRSAQEGHDVKMPLVSDGKGHYTAKTTLAWKGEWEVYVSATADGYNYQKATVVYLR